MEVGEAGATGDWLCLSVCSQSLSVSSHLGWLGFLSAWWPQGSKGERQKELQPLS